MKIDRYTFGNLYIDGEHFSSDLIIFPDRVESGWWRQKGHHLELVDIQAALTAQPDLLIIGTGFYGLMKVDRAVEDHLKKNTIEYFIGKTGNAVKKYNEHSARENVVAAFHLTC